MYLVVELLVQQPMDLLVRQLVELHWNLAD
jgi:hypothetical protein